MMATADILLHTVYMAYSPRDEALAAELRRKLADDGVTTQRSDKSVNGENPWLAIRDAIAECEFVVVLATENYIHSTNLVYEFGIASAWQKPVYVMTKEVSQSALPKFLQDCQHYPFQDTIRLLDAIHRDRLKFSVEESAWLGDWYRSTQTPLDQLLTRPGDLQDLTRSFRKSWKRSVPPERLVRELLRLRKQGKLPSLRRRASASNTR